MAALTMHKVGDVTFARAKSHIVTPCQRVINGAFDVSATFCILHDRQLNIFPNQIFCIFILNSQINPALYFYQKVRIAPQAPVTKSGVSRSGSTL